jgi:hypothetical protein
MKQRSLDSFMTGSERDTNKRTRYECSEKVSITVENSKFAACPLCEVCLPMHLLISHAAGCDGKASHEIESCMSRRKKFRSDFVASLLDEQKDSVKNDAECCGRPEKGET